jgi:hypothetical protein
MKNLPKAVQAEVSKPVMAWLNYMGALLMIGSAIFAFSQTTALIILVLTVLSGISAFALFQVYPNIYVVGIPQLVFWTPLLGYIYKTEFAAGTADFSQPFIIWLAIASLTMAISILLDLRDLYLVVSQRRGAPATKA